MKALAVPIALFLLIKLATSQPVTIDSHGIEQAEEEGEHEALKQAHENSYPFTSSSCDVARKNLQDIRAKLFVKMFLAQHMLLIDSNLTIAFYRDWTKEGCSQRLSLLDKFRITEFDDYQLCRGYVSWIENHLGNSARMKALSDAGLNSTLYVISSLLQQVERSCAPDPEDQQLSDTLYESEVNFWESKAQITGKVVSEIVDNASLFGKLFHRTITYVHKHPVSSVKSDPLNWHVQPPLVVFALTENEAFAAFLGYTVLLDIVAEEQIMVNRMRDMWRKTIFTRPKYVKASANQNIAVQQALNTIFDDVDLNTTPPLHSSSNLFFVHKWSNNSILSWNIQVLVSNTMTLFNTTLGFMMSFVRSIGLAVICGVLVLVSIGSVTHRTSLRFIFHSCRRSRGDGLKSGLKGERDRSKIMRDPHNTYGSLESNETLA